MGIIKKQSYNKENLTNTTTQKCSTTWYRTAIKNGYQYNNNNPKMGVVEEKEPTWAGKTSRQGGTSFIKIFSS